jgi:hypothetical protein
MAFFNKLFGGDDESVPRFSVESDSANATSQARERSPAMHADAGSDTSPDARSLETPRLRALVIATALGPVNDAWLGDCRLSLSRLRAATEQAGESGLLQAVERLEQWCDSQAVGLPSRTGLKQLLAHFDELLPGERTLYEEVALRDQLLVDNLLRQLPGATKPLLDKLDAAGLWSVHELAWLDVNAAAKRCALTGEEDKQRLAQFRLLVLTHLEGRRQLQPPESSLGFRKAMIDACKHLQEQESLFQRAQAEDDKVLVRRAREDRRIATLRINVLLIESDQLAELELQEPMSTAERLRRLSESYGFSN